MSWNDELKQRIQQLAGDNEAAFAKKAGISDQAFRKYLKGTVPGGVNILKIALAGKRSTDWLLTGKETAGDCILPPGYDEFCAMLKEILTQSSDEQVKKALRTNLVAFKNSVEKDAKKAGQDERIKKLESEYTDLKNKMHYLEELYDRKTKSDT